MALRNIHPAPNPTLSCPHLPTAHPLSLSLSLCATQEDIAALRAELEAKSRELDLHMTTHEGVLAELAKVRCPSAARPGAALAPWCALQL